VFALAALLLVVAGLTTALGRSAAASAPQTDNPITLTSTFTATVLQGPVLGPALSGTLRLQIGTHGSLTGMLVRKAHPPIKVVGQIKGQLIGLFFNLGKGQNIFGTGVIGYDSLQQRNVMDGTFNGPTDTARGLGMRVYTR
jgi:hypothetical protein